MFAYCLNNPVNYIDPEGTDAIIIIIEENAGSFGHVAICVQDTNGTWHYYSFGSIRHKLYTLGKSVLGRYVEGRVVHYEIDSPKGNSMATFDAIIDFLGADADLKEVAPSIDGVIYLAGDFSEVVSYYDGLLTQENVDYNLFDYNCMHMALDAISESGALSVKQRMIIDTIRFMNNNCWLSNAPNVVKNLLCYLGNAMWDGEKWYEEMFD